MSRQLTAARKLLSDAQLIAFLRAAAKDDHVRAPRFICEQLNEGQSLEEIFDNAQAGREPHFAMHATLRVKRVTSLTYVIAVGLGGGTVGDGGEWRVRYNAQGEVEELEDGLMWMH